MPVLHKAERKVRHFSDRISKEYGRMGRNLGAGFAIAFPVTYFQVTFHVRGYSFRG
jgi:hypothetical protein